MSGMPDGHLRLGTAPDSWGVWFPEDPRQVPWTRFLDEASRARDEWIEPGAMAQLCASRVAAGTPSSLGVEVRGAKGFARVDSITSNELLVSTDDPGVAPWTNGPRHVVMGPQHPYFADVAPMPGGGVGTSYGDAFVAEVQTFLRAVLEGAEGGS